ncbi:tRNA 2-thiouridine(34) synthase MnmA [Psittacicella melopsittaci]|uniref:tRNA-specific 2-thiouridylase MnmA n=1 Tax=Psittacicella melopsittaci TaxID=2028576 RepID=A0A3A1Y5V9_9GAMM|nr:tRNA 2-thiouridine(34) synthase MnmA [Psittacicella melopsittaci]RIY32666.1 tRNA 2-thiouridine(34) synthase MnmA [Psittacicella melopsittaci]
MTEINSLIAHLKAQAKPENANTKVIVGMSGGVDSSVSAYILQLQGYDVEGVFMKNWEEDDGTEYCTAAVDLADAQAVADQLGIKLHKINFAAEYWDNVFENFLQEYAAGRTPNPDILCNKEIKFKAFLDYALEDLNADLIATGHYCRRGSNRDGKATLLRGLDNNKDQSYFLYTLSQDVLAKVLFPVGELEKPQVRLIAEHLNLRTAKKKDSTGICFIGERKFADFLSTYLPAKRGEIRNLADNQVLGTHNGAMYYTIGQRKGLGIGGIQGHQDAGWYVAKKDVTNNIVYVVDSDKDPALYASGCTVTQLHSTSLSYMDFIDQETGRVKEGITCKVRYRSQDVTCHLSYLDEQTLQVTFDAPQWAITPGQSAVFYYGERCLGGGIIDQIIA